MKNDKEVEITNKTGDRRYFTMVPNYILNHSTSTAQSLYLQLKRLAGEDQTTRCGSRYLMNQLSISYNTLKKELRYLINKGWIEYMGKVRAITDGGPQKLNSYRIIDLWELNTKEYQNRNTLKKEVYQENNQGVSKTEQGPIKTVANEELINNKEHCEWSLEKELQKMEEKSGSYLDIIATFIRKKPLIIEDQNKLTAVISRHARDAKQIENGQWDIGKIFWAIDKIRNENRIRRSKEQPEVDWTVGTIWKYLTK